MSTAKIFVGGVLHGTAWLIHRSHAVTAAHCVGEMATEVKLHFWNPEEKDYLPIVACVVEKDVLNDGALLKLAVAAPDWLTPYFGCALTDCPGGVENWEATGYPAAGDEFVHGFSITGQIAQARASLHLAGNPAAIQLTCDQTEALPRAELVDGSGSPVHLLAGVSGSAVRVLSQDRSVVGLVRCSPMPFAGTTIYATPLESLWPRFQHHLVGVTLRAWANVRNSRPTRQGIDPSCVSIGRLPVVSSKFFGRDAELALLDTAWRESRLSILSIIAWGGVGKSALVFHWLQRMAARDYEGAERVYAWSFFSQGSSERAASGALFVADALAWFGDKDPSAGTPWEKGERLARLIKGRRILMVLDGLEPLQFAPGPQENELKDQSVIAFLRELAAANAGLCLITSRQRVKNIEDYENSTVQQVPIEHLSPEAGAELLDALGVHGEPSELRHASEDFEGHGLALQLLGSYLTDVAGGDVRMRDRIGPLDTDTRFGGQARRVMKSYEEMFKGRSELEVLRLLGFFNRPAPMDAFRALSAKPVIPGLTGSLQGLADMQWNGVFARLRRTRLLSRENPDEPDKLDTHPLVREHFHDYLKGLAADQGTGRTPWREGCNRLYEYFKDVAEEYPNTIEGMEPLFQAVYYGCEAGRHQDAWVDVYLRRIARGDEDYAGSKLGAVMQVMAVLGNFFENGEPIGPGTQRQGLAPDHQRRMLVEMGNCLTEALSYTNLEAQRCFLMAGSLSGGVEVIAILEGRWRIAVGICKLDEAVQIAKEVKKIAYLRASSFSRVDACRMFANPLYWKANFRRALLWANKGLRVIEEVCTTTDKGSLPTDFVQNLLLHNYRSMALWQLGFPDAALRQSQAAVEAIGVKQIEATLAISMWMHAFIHVFRGEVHETLQTANRVIELSTGKYASWLAIGRILKGWAASQLGDHQSGLESLDKGIKAWKDGRLILGIPFWLCLRVDILVNLSRHDDALKSIEEGCILAEKHNDRWWEPELYRLRAEILAGLKKDKEAVESAWRGISLARKHGAKSLELRALASAVHRRFALPEDVVKSLDALRGSFTEGFSTRDLVCADQVLVTSTLPPFNRNP